MSQLCVSTHLCAWVYSLVSVAHSADTLGTRCGTPASLEGPRSCPLGALPLPPVPRHTSGWFTGPEAPPGSRPAPPPSLSMAPEKIPLHLSSDGAPPPRGQLGLAPGTRRPGSLPGRCTLAPPSSPARSRGLSLWTHLAFQLQASAPGGPHCEHSLSRCHAVSFPPTVCSAAAAKCPGWAASVLDACAPCAGAGA